MNETEHQGAVAMTSPAPAEDRLKVTGFRGNPLRIVLNNGDEATITQKLIDAFASPSPFDREAGHHGAAGMADELVSSQNFFPSESPPQDRLRGSDGITERAIAALQEWSDQKYGSPFSVSACNDLLNVLHQHRLAEPILKGVGKIDGDGWKDSTKKGEIVFVWNREHPKPYVPGQYPRVGREHWSASTEQYDFSPAALEEIEALFSKPSPAEHVVGGIELAARFVEKRRDDFIREHGSYDYGTGFMEFAGEGLEYVGELDEIIEGIRALTPKSTARDETATRNPSEAYLMRLANEISALKLHPTTTQEFDSGYVAGRYDAFLIVQEAAYNAPDTADEKPLTFSATEDYIAEFGIPGWAKPVAKVINDNQPGNTAIIEIQRDPPTLEVGTLLFASPPSPETSLMGFQDRVAEAHHPLFQDDPTDVAERVARHKEESNELCQALGMAREEAHRLVDYTWDRPVGEPAKEIGSTLLTLASLCVVAGYDLAACGEADLEKLQRPETIARIRAKRATRHGRGPLPGLDPAAASEGSTDTYMWHCVAPAEDRGLYNADEADFCTSDEANAKQAAEDGFTVTPLFTAADLPPPIEAHTAMAEALQRPDHHSIVFASSKPLKTEGEKNG